MLKNRIKLFMLLFLLYSSNSYSQRVQFLKDFGLDIPFGYNFFINQKNKNFQTTINGLGSGFCDLTSGKLTANLISIGSKNIYFSTGVGIASYKYRFTDNIFFLKENNRVSYYIDKDTEKEYGNGFFSYGKSKLVLYSFVLPLKLNLKTNFVKVSAGIFVDFYLSGHAKNKYIKNGEYVKSMIKKSQFKNYNINKTKIGSCLGIKHTKTGIKINAEYFLSPLFNNNIEIQQARISLIIPVYLLL